MKIFLTYLLFCIFYGMPAILTANEKPAFYIWQRCWDSDKSKIAKASDRELFPLAMEYSLVNGKTRLERVDVPREILDAGNVTPVIRVHAGLLSKLTPEKLSSDIKQLKSKRIQLDIDCPENKLLEYSSYIDGLKKFIPEMELSITVLPCHLRHKEFKALAEKVSYYVLQIHGLYLPETVNDECILMKHDVSLKAIQEARNIGHPFRVAIPSYSYQLLFEKKSGRLKGIYQDFTGPENTSYKARLTPLDYNMLHDIISMKPSLSLIWFRMPFQGERFNLDMKTITALENGLIPEPECNVFFTRENSRIDLFVKAEALLSNQRVNINITWTNKLGESELFNGTVNISDNKDFGILPVILSAPMPGCGEKLKIASFYTDESPSEIKESVQ